MAALTRVTAAESHSLQRRAAGWLRDSGLVRGDRLAVECDGSPQYLALVGAALRTGVVPVPIPSQLPAGDRAFMIGDAGVCAEAGPSDWVALRTAAPGQLADVPLCRPMLYTSGTTGRRKGVWFGVWDDDTARRAYDDECEQWGFSSDDVHLVCSPLYHSAPLRFALHTLLAGGDVVIQTAFDAQATVSALVDGGITTSFMVPAHLQRLTGDALPPAVPTLRWLAHAGSPCPEDVKRSVIAWLGASTVWEFYGSTEAQFTACRADEWCDHPGTVGRTRVGRTLSVDDASVVWCTQPDFARFEYWGTPEKTAEAWRGEACTVGDIGTLDAEGRLFLRGRREDLIVSGGVNVYPAEVDRVLLSVHGVTNGATFGIDDERWGQKVVFAYTGSVTEQLLRSVAEDQLVPPSRPKQYVRVDDLPVGVLGKVSRVRLAEWFARVD